MKSLHSVILRIRGNTDTLGSVTNIKTGESSVESVETTILTKTKKNFSE